MRTVVAGVSRINDSVAATVMTAYHDRLLDGADPAAALAGALDVAGDVPAPLTCSEPESLIIEWVLLLVGLVLIAGPPCSSQPSSAMVTVDRATVSRQAGDGDTRARR